MLFTFVSPGRSEPSPGGRHDARRNSHRDGDRAGRDARGLPDVCRIRELSPLGHLRWRRGLQWIDWDPHTPARPEDGRLRAELPRPPRLQRARLRRGRVAGAHLHVRARAGGDYTGRGDGARYHRDQLQRLQFGGGARPSHAGTADARRELSRRQRIRAGSRAVGHRRRSGARLLAASGDEHAEPGSARSPRPHHPQQRHVPHAERRECCGALQQAGRLRSDLYARRRDLSARPSCRPSPATRSRTRT